VALTGAGVSTASGIPDFRSAGGLWERVDPMEVASIGAFRRDPDRVWEFYRARLDLMTRVAPNPAHEALARLERDGLLQALITQNVDGLHAASGSPDPVEVHGSLAAAVCPRCGARVERSEVEARLAAAPGAPLCTCGSPLKPGVVLFGELLPEAAVERAFALAEASDLILCCGTSLEVHPVAGLPGVVLERGGVLAILTDGPTPYDDEAAYRLHGPLAELLPRLAALATAPG
jgi:NAD-dependent protein deacetylase/lipoamidase